MHQARKRAGMFAIVMASTTGVGAVTVAEGSSITFTEMFSYADGLGDETVLLPKFDTLGGARELAGVTLSLNLSTTLRAGVQNGLDVGQVVEATTTGYHELNQIGAWFGGVGSYGTPLSFLHLDTDIDDWDHRRHFRLG
jgi:hypothetical protein